MLDSRFRGNDKECGNDSVAQASLLEIKLTCWIPVFTGMTKSVGMIKDRGNDNVCWLE